MLFPRRLALGTLLLALPGLSRAQSAPTTDSDDAPAPKFYVGLAAYHSNYQNLGSWRQGDTGFPVPVQLTAGYQLRPRLALELGVAYSGRTARDAYDYAYNAGGTSIYYYQYTGTFTDRTASVSALARYTLTRRPAHRLQVDALGGLTLAHRSFYSRGSESSNQSGSLQTFPFNIRDSYSDLLLTAGLGLRYRISPRVGLNFDLTTNYNLNHRNTFREFTGSAALAVRYRFGK